MGVGADGGAVRRGGFCVVRGGAERQQRRGDEGDVHGGDDEQAVVGRRGQAVPGRQGVRAEVGTLFYESEGAAARHLRGRRGLLIEENTRRIIKINK